MTINEMQDEVIAEFSDFDDWMDRYQLLIDLGNEQPALDERYKTDQNLIEGCQSRVWLQADEEDGKVIFQAESDALIVKGIIALLIKVLSGHTPDLTLAHTAQTCIPTPLECTFLFPSETRQGLRHFVYALVIKQTDQNQNIRAAETKPVLLTDMQKTRHWTAAELFRLRRDRYTGNTQASSPPPAGVSPGFAAVPSR